MKIAILGSALFLWPRQRSGGAHSLVERVGNFCRRSSICRRRAVGILLIVAGLPGLVDSFARFALQGLGTPAPIAPTQNLVVTGLYRYVRPRRLSASSAHNGGQIAEERPSHWGQVKSLVPPG